MLNRNVTKKLWKKYTGLHSNSQADLITKYQRNNWERKSPNIKYMYIQY